MARKNRKTGRYQSTSRRTRRKPKTNLTNIAQSLLVAQVVSRNTTGLGIYDFLTAGTSMNDMRSSGWEQSGDPHSSRITLKEIMQGAQVGSGISINNAFMSNLKANAVPLIASVILIPVAFNVGSKLLRKPVILPANRLLKSVGLKDVKL